MSQPLKMEAIPSDDLVKSVSVVILICKWQLFKRLIYRAKV
jgi:hypothetical protein